MHAIDDARRRGDQVDIELALEPLADDLEMQQPEKAAAEAEAERGRGLHLVGEARIVEAELADRLAQILELARIDRKQAAEHHRLRRLEAGERRRRRGFFSSVTVSPTRVSATCLIEAVKKPISPGPSAVAHLLLGAEDADAVDLVGAAGQHQPDALALVQRAVEDAHQHDHAEIGVVPAVDQQRLERRCWRRPWARAGGARSPRAPPRRPCRSWPRSRARHGRRARSRPRSAGARGRAPPPAGRSCSGPARPRGGCRAPDRHWRASAPRRLGVASTTSSEPSQAASAAVHLIGEIDMARRVDQVQLVELRRPWRDSRGARSAP